MKAADHKRVGELLIENDSLGRILGNVNELPDHAASITISGVTINLKKSDPFFSAVIDRFRARAKELANELTELGVDLTPPKSRKAA